MVLSIPSAAAAAPQEPPGKVYLLVADKLSIDDINPQQMPNLTGLVRKGAVGLASTRTLGGNTTENGALTIGAGNLARSYTNGIRAYNTDEQVHGFTPPAGDLYRSLTGKKPPADGCVLLNLPEIMAGMITENTNTRLGSLGETLKLHGYSVCLLGNQDTGHTSDAKFRSAAAIAMDAWGRVPLGDISARTTTPSISFLGLETNYTFLLKETVRLRELSDVMVIELSDLARLDNAATALPDITAAERNRLLHNMDAFIGQISRQMSPRDLLLVISPSPSKSQLEAKNSFTPVVAFGAGYRGALTSGSTRRNLVVANTDIAPTVLAFMGIKEFDLSMIGQPMTAKYDPAIDALKEAQILSATSAQANRLRAPLVKGYVVFQIIVIAIALCGLTVFNRSLPWLSPLIVAVGVVPLVLLPLGRLNLPFDWLYGLIAVVVSIIGTWLLCLGFRRRYLSAFVCLSLLSVLALDFDLLTGATMIKSSVLGYDPMAGARYYGVGNEYMGVIIGSSILAGAAFYQRWPRKPVLWMIGVFLVLQALLISAPGLGANTDGVITAPAAFLVTLMLLSDLRISLRTLMILASLIGASVLGLIAVDLSRPPELQSHVGRAATQIIDGGWREALTIIARKGSMNLKLMRYTVWSRVFLAMLAALVILIYRPVGAMSRIKSDYPRLFQGFAGIVVGAVVGLVVNDSGIVAAATTSIYVIAPILLLMLNQNPGAGEETASNHPGSAIP